MSTFASDALRRSFEVLLHVLIGASVLLTLPKASLADRPTPTDPVPGDLRRVEAPAPDTTDPAHALLTRVLGDGRSTTVMLETIPDSLTEVIPLPPKTHVYGSVQRAEPSGSRRPSHLQIYADVPGAPSTVYRFFSRQLPDRGWEGQDRSRHRSGFTEAKEQYPRRYCRDKEVLEVQAARPGDGADTTALEIRYVHFPEKRGAPCNQEERHRRRRSDRTDPLIPQINLPDFARESRRLRAAPETDMSQTMLKADTTAKALHDAFASSLRADDWRLEARGGSDRNRWSEWQVPRPETSPAQGRLIVIRLTEDGLFGATVLTLPGGNRQ